MREVLIYLQLILGLMISCEAHPNPEPHRSARMMMRNEYLGYPDSDLVYYTNDNGNDKQISSARLDQQTDIIFKPLRKDYEQTRGSKHPISERENDCNRKLMDSISKITEKASENIDKLEEKLTEDVNKILKKLTDHIGKIEHKMSHDSHKLEEKITEEVNKFEEKITDKVTHFEEKLNGEVIKIDEKVTGINSESPGDRGKNIYRNGKKYFQETKDISNYNNKIEGIKVDSSFSNNGYLKSSHKKKAHGNIDNSRIHFIDIIDKHDADTTRQPLNYEQKNVFSETPKRRPQILFPNLMDPADEEKKGRREIAAYHSGASSHNNFQGIKGLKEQTPQVHDRRSKRAAIYIGTPTRNNAHQISNFQHQTEWKQEDQKPFQQEYRQPRGNENKPPPDLQDDNHEAKRAQGGFMIIPLRGQREFDSQTRMDRTNYGSQRNHGSQQLSEQNKYDNHRELTRQKVGVEYESQREYGSQVPSGNVEFEGQVEYSGQQKIGKIEFENQREYDGQLSDDNVEFSSQRQTDEIEFGSQREDKSQMYTGQIEFGTESKSRDRHRTSDIDLGNQRNINGQRHASDEELGNRRRYDRLQTGYVSLDKHRTDDVEFGSQTNLGGQQQTDDIDFDDGRLFSGQKQSDKIEFGSQIDYGAQHQTDSMDRHDLNKKIEFQRYQKSDIGYINNTQPGVIKIIYNGSSQTDHNEELLIPKPILYRPPNIRRDQNPLSLENPGDRYEREGQTTNMQYTNVRVYYNSHMQPNTGQGHSQTQAGHSNVQKLSGQNNMKNQKEFHSRQKETDVTGLHNKRDSNLGQQQIDSVSFNGQRTSYNNQRGSSHRYRTPQNINKALETQVFGQPSIYNEKRRMDKAQYTNQRGPYTFQQSLGTTVNAGNQMNIHANQEPSEVELDSPGETYTGQEHIDDVQFSNSRGGYIGQEQMEEIPFGNRRNEYSGQAPLDDVQFDSRNSGYLGQEQTDKVQFDSQNREYLGQEQTDKVQFDSQNREYLGQEQTDEVQFDSQNREYLGQEQTDEVQFDSRNREYLGQEQTDEVQFDSRNREYLGQEQTDEVQFDSRNREYLGQEQTDEVQFDGQNVRYLGQEQSDKVLFNSQNSGYLGQEQTDDVQFDSHSGIYTGQEQSDYVPFDNQGQTQVEEAQFSNQKGYYNTRDTQRGPNQGQVQISQQNSRQSIYIPQSKDNTQINDGKGYVSGQHTEESVQFNNQKGLYSNQRHMDDTKNKNPRDLSDSQVQMNYGQFDSPTNYNPSRTTPVSNQRVYYGGHKQTDDINVGSQREIGNNQKIMNKPLGNQNRYPSQQEEPDKIQYSNMGQLGGERQNNPFSQSGSYYDNRHQMGSTTQFNRGSPFKGHAQTGVPSATQRDFTLNNRNDPPSSELGSFHNPPSRNFNPDVNPHYISNSNTPLISRNRYSHNNEMPTNLDSSSRTNYRSDFSSQSYYSDTPPRQTLTDVRYTQRQQPDYSLPSSDPFLPTRSVELTTKVNRYRKMEELLDELERDLVRFTEANSSDATVSETVNRAANVSPLETYTSYPIPTRPHFEYNSDEEEEDTSSFWSNLGNKFKTTYKKAKDKTKQMITDIKEKMS